MWTTADSSELNQLPNGGWELHNGEYRIIWFEGRQLPESFKPDSILAEDADTDEDLHLSSDDENVELSD